MFEITFEIEKLPSMEPVQGVYFSRLVEDNADNPIDILCM